MTPVDATDQVEQAFIRSVFLTFGDDRSNCRLPGPFYPPQAIADFSLLCNDESRHKRSNINFSPAVWYRLIAALHIAHRNGYVAHVAFLKPLADFV